MASVARSPQARRCDDLALGEPTGIQSTAVTISWETEMSDENEDHLLLKWGTIKGWNIKDPEALALLKRYFAEGVPWSAMTDHPDEARKAILCDLIRAHKGTIMNDWDGESYTKERAIEYVTSYGQRKTA
jgi:hypothetical protein